MRKEKAWLSLIGLAIVLPRWSTFAVPILAIDEAIYAIFGQEILQGALPYRELVDYKPPLIFYLYALAFRLGGSGSMFMVHLFHLAVVAALCWVLFRLGECLGNRKTGFFAALFYAIFSAAWTSKHALATNAEPLMVLPLSMAALLYVRNLDAPKLTRDFGSGFCLGLAFLTKYTSGINLPLTLAFILCVEPFLAHKFKRNAEGKPLKAPGLSKALLRGLSCGCGFLLPTLICVGYFQSRGALWDLWFWGWNYNRTYIAQGGHYLSWDYFLLKLLARSFIFACGGLLIWILGGGKIIQSLKAWKKAFGKSAGFPESAGILFVLAWFLASFLPVCVGGRFFYHYYIQLLPPLCLLAALNVDYFWRSKHGKAALIVLTLVPLTLFLTESSLRVFEKPNLERILGEYLREHTAFSERIFIWGYLPAALYYAERRPASRFVFSQFLTGSTPMTHGMDFDPSKPQARPSALRRVLMDFDPKDPPLQIYDTTASVVPQAWDMLMEDLRSTRPVYIVDTSPANIARYGKYPISQYPRLKEFLETNYDLEKTVDNVALYRIREQHHPTGAGVE